jgi:hypothetical protein
MGILATAASVYRDHTTLGVPASGKHRPLKAEIRALFADVQANLGAVALRPENYGFVQADTTTHLPCLRAMWAAANVISSALPHTTDTLSRMLVMMDLTGCTFRLPEQWATGRGRGIYVKGGAFAPFPTSNWSKQFALIAVNGAYPCDNETNNIHFDGQDIDCLHVCQAFKVTAGVRSSIRNCNIVHQAGDPSVLYGAIRVTGNNADYLGTWTIAFNIIHQWSSNEVASVNTNALRNGVGVIFENGAGDSAVYGNLIGWGGDCIVCLVATAVDIRLNHIYCGSIGVPANTAFAGNCVKLVSCYLCDVQMNNIDSGEVYIEGNWNNAVKNNKYYYNGVNASANLAFVRLHTSVANTYFVFPMITGNYSDSQRPIFRLTTSGAGSFTGNVPKMVRGMDDVNINIGRSPMVYINGGAGSVSARFISNDPTFGLVAFEGVSTSYAPDMGADGDDAVIRTYGVTRLRAKADGGVEVPGGGGATISLTATRSGDGTISRAFRGSSAFETSVFSSQIFAMGVGNILNLGTQTNHLVQMLTNNTGRTAWSNTNFYPITDNAIELGGTGNRWSVVRAVNGTIQTSDQRLKVFFGEVADARDLSRDDAVAIVRALRPGLFRWKVGGRETESIQTGTRRVERQVMRTVEKTVTRIEIRDGVAVEVTAVETVQEPEFRFFPLVDSSGNPVVEIVAPERKAMRRSATGGIEEITISAETRQKMHSVPVMETVEEPVFEQVTTETAGRRAHLGIRAQDLKAIMDTLGLDFSMWGLEDPNDPDSEQHVRPDQMVWVLTMTLQAMEARFETRLAALEARRR